jgi:hypothetical protein
MIKINRLFNLGELSITSNDVDWFKFEIAADDLIQVVPSASYNSISKSPC